MRKDYAFLWEAYKQVHAPKTVDDQELAQGIEVELEHRIPGDSDEVAREKARKVALDHLAEDPKYYTKLKKAGL